MVEHTHENEHRLQLSNYLHILYQLSGICCNNIYLKFNYFILTDKSEQLSMFLISTSNIIS